MNDFTFSSYMCVMQKVNNSSEIYETKLKHSIRNFQDLNRALLVTA